ncbi:MAG: hypothetical protein WC496_06265 [Phycisphaerae bacterium]|jgi:hypothetical protein
MRTKIGVLVLLAFLFLPVCAQATTIWTEGHHVIDANQTYDGVIEMYNDSSLDMYSGSIQSIEAYDETIINLRDGHITEFRAYGESTFNVLGGDINQLMSLETSITNLYAGEIYALWGKKNSIINIYNSQIDILMAMENSIVNLYAYDIIHTVTGGIYNLGQVTGKYYLDDSSFCFDLAYGDGNVYSHINIVPEPTMLMLLSFGGLLLRKK